MARNQVSVDIFLGDAGLLKQEEEYDVFIANINRNILLDNMEIYSKSIVKGGSLLLSGFYKADIPVLESKCKACGLVLLSVLDLPFAFCSQFCFNIEMYGRTVSSCTSNII